MEIKRKIILVVQGEGRGHMTQAITMYDILTSKGHEVPVVLVGTSDNREIPSFFYNKINTRIVKFKSPNFITDKKSKSIKIGASITHNLMHLKTFKESIKQLRGILNQKKPDLIINFYDLLIGLLYTFNKPSIPLISIAHQYIYLHPEFKFPKGHFFDRLTIKKYTKLTAVGSSKKLALSFYNLPQYDKDNVSVVPPLLRKEVFDLTTQNKPFYLAYMVNHGYFEDIVFWHKKNPEVEIHCFTDKIDLLKNFDFNPEKLFLHALNDVEFLEKMSETAGLVSTAGFESVCEAMYLGKPVLMVPVKGHFEQFCNSRDAYYAGAGVYDDSFNIDKLINFTSAHSYQNDSFRAWASNGKEKIYKEIMSVLN